MSKALAKRNPLPSKEATLFKELLTLYETRQLKKGLKTAEQILKKFPEHGETLCMKGLLLTHMGRREEGIDLVKKGVRLDLMSHICWHVFGLIQKADKNYEEALKSYTQALKFDKENMNLLRDSAQLQTHLRLFENLVDTRHTILRLRPNLRQNWVALAVAHHLNGQFAEARKVLEHYLRSLKNVTDADIEHSETLLYYVSVLEELGEFQEALSVLNQNARSRSIIDRTAILERRARLLSKLRSPEAEDAWHALIEHNPDNYDSYRGYLADKGIDLDTPSREALSTLQKFAELLTRATAPRRLQLNITSGSDFHDLAKTYITRGVEKGIPSLFADLKALYADKEKQAAIEDIADSLREEYAPSDSPSKNIEPTTYLWTLYFLAQHYSYLSQHSKALTLLSEALLHTPTLPELHLLRGRVLKRSGDFLGAVRAVNDARALDGQDRFLNTKCGKYLLRAGCVEDAERIFGMFTKKDAISPAVDLDDMQSLLFLLEEADAYRHLNKPNMALKRYMAVKKVFDEYEDDQFDFHGYNLRKFTIGIYFNLLKWEDQLRSHPAYVKAAIEASKIFVSLHDDPSILKSLTSSSTSPDPDALSPRRTPGPPSRINHFLHHFVGPLSDAEKKAKSKAKKAAKKVQEHPDKSQQNQNASADKDLEPAPPKDDDPDGMKLLATPDPLEQAAKLLQPIVKQLETKGTISDRRSKEGKTKSDVDVWTAVYDVAIRRKKLLQAVGALNHAKALNPHHPALHIRLVDLKQRASSLPQPPSSPIGSVFTSSISELLPDELSLETYNSQYLQQHSSNPNAVLACARVSQLLGAPLPDVEATVFGIFAEEVELDILTALETLSFLSFLKSARVDEFKVKSQERFPLSTAFKSSEEQAALKAQIFVVSTVDGSESAQDGKDVVEVVP
ncbi:hypothetical protein NLJ89_g8800 [Agrocybe chaxingu]|uniref:Uncharacterized protein n=1 Tax=Agrocybe chaxingu TaxID=84603 RepID=A0A9W8JUR3_9AGAR|nr:hypothetical protein NLJ89_g8800 [Agrocybe chaxingu]